MPIISLDLYLKLLKINIIVPNYYYAFKFLKSMQNIAILNS